MLICRFEINNSKKSAKLICPGIGTFEAFTGKEALFRLHPKVGSGVSLGCITLTHKSEFDFLRTKLLNQEPMNIPNTSIRIFGIILVRALDSIKNVC